MWTNFTRAYHARAGLALPGDLTDAEWAVLEPFFPPPPSHVDRPRNGDAADCRGDPLSAARRPDPEALVPIALTDGATSYSILR
jgi:hypothetical protein